MFELSKKEIKFRWYDEDNKVWLEQENGVYLIDQSGNLFYVEDDSWEIIEIGHSQYGKRNIIVEQFTGGMDCENKRIYEGDIVQQIGLPFAETQIITPINNCFVSKFIGGEQDIYRHIADCSTSFKIVGTIHDLKGENK